MKTSLTLTNNTLIPYRALSTFFHDTETSFERSLITHLAGGKKKLQSLKIPLGVLLAHAESLYLCPLPWGTANLTNTEWWAYNLRSSLESEFKRPVDTKSLAQVFNLPKQCLAVQPIADSVNGMLLMADGWGYQCRWAWYNPSAHRLYGEEEGYAAITSDNEEQFISAKQVIGAILAIDMGKLQEAVKTTGLTYEVSNVQDFEKAADFFLNVFQAKLVNGQKRTAVNDFDQALKNRRFWFSFGSGSNIQVISPITHIPQPVTV